MESWLSIFLHPLPTPSGELLQPLTLYCEPVFTHILTCHAPLTRFGFTKSPQLELSAKPKLGQREVKLAAVSQWIEKKLRDVVKVLQYIIYVQSLLSRAYKEKRACN